MPLRTGESDIELRDGLLQLFDFVQLLQISSSELLDLFLVIVNHVPPEL